MEIECTELTDLNRYFDFESSFGHLIELHQIFDFCQMKVRIWTFDSSEDNLRYLKDMSHNLKFDKTESNFDI